MDDTVNAVAGDAANNDSLNPVVLYRGDDFARAPAVASKELSRPGRGTHATKASPRPARTDDLIEGDNTKEQYRDGSSPDWKFKEIWVAHRHNARHEPIEATSIEDFYARAVVARICLPSRALMPDFLAGSTE